MTAGTDHGPVPLGCGADAVDVVRALDARTRDLGAPPPAALIGSWLGADAVIAPSMQIAPAAAVPEPTAQYWFGHLGYPDRTAQAWLPPVTGGTTESVLLLRDGQWLFHDVHGRPCPDWIRQSISGGPPSEWRASWSAPERGPHLAAITTCLAAIAAGEIYQACVCTRFVGSFCGSVADYFADGVAAHRPRKSALLQGDWGSLVSFSPETFLHRRGNHVSSSPIKGTAPAASDPAVLAASTKDVAENVMIVDLVRNDFGRVAIPGTVRVPELLRVQPAPGVWHLVSTVTAGLRTGVGTAELLEATFPPASVTGTPKIRARELLDDWETHARGAYCGAIGVQSPAGELDLNVAIRTVEITADGRCALGVGGGITIDSDPAREWQECLDKAASTLAIQPRRSSIS